MSFCSHFRDFMITQFSVAFQVNFNVKWYALPLHCHESHKSLTLLPEPGSNLSSGCDWRLESCAGPHESWSLESWPGICLAQPTLACVLQWPPMANGPIETIVNVLNCTYADSYHVSRVRNIKHLSYQNKWHLYQYNIIVTMLLHLHYMYVPKHPWFFPTIKAAAFVNNVNIVERGI